MKDIQAVIEKAQELEQAIQEFFGTERYVRILAIVRPHNVWKSLTEIEAESFKDTLIESAIVFKDERYNPYGDERQVDFDASKNINISFTYELTLESQKKALENQLNEVLAKQTEGVLAKQTEGRE